MGPGWYHRAGSLQFTLASNRQHTMSAGHSRPKTSSRKIWGTWLIVAPAWLAAHLPLRAVVACGRAVGWLGYYLAARRRHITETNMGLCFPQLNQAERRALARKTFQHVGVGALETAVTWLTRRETAPRFTVDGIEHLQEAQALQRGVLLVGYHFTAPDISSQAISRLVDTDVMYRANRNPVWERLQVAGRKRYHDGVVERSDTRSVLRKLKAGHTIVYLADQDYGPKHSVFAPFFGVPAASITAPTRLARLNNSPVVFMETTRDWHTLTWHVTFSEPLADYPSDDEVADATRLNALVEAAVARHPDQYLWLHRRFKTRPDGEAPLY